MNIQELCDGCTVLCHQGKAMAKVIFVSGYETKNVNGIKLIGDDIALITSETSETKDAEKKTVQLQDVEKMTLEEKAKDKSDKAETRMIVTARSRLEFKRYKDGYYEGYLAGANELQEVMRKDLVSKLKELISYSTSPSCTKGMELFIKRIENWDFMKE